MLKTKLPMLSGKEIDLANPDPAQICAEDIAVALAKQCRFHGCTKWFYSVAEHCVISTWHVSEPLKIHALLHDAAEAYIGDIITPVKAMLPEVREIERKILAAIYEGLGVKPPDKEEGWVIKGVDMGMLVTEWSQVVGLPAAPWMPERVEPFAVQLPGWTWQEAEKRWLRCYRKLRGGDEG